MTDIAWSAFQQSDDTTDLYEAIVAAFAEIENVAKDSTADAGSYVYKYVSLGAIMQTVRGPLAAHGLAIVQAPATEVVNGGLRVSVTTRLVHTSGQWIEASASVGVAGNAPAQAIGSAITYARRYGLTALLGIASEDDDGAGAQAAAPTAAPPMVRAAGIKTAIANAIGQTLAKEWWHLEERGDGPWPLDAADRMKADAIEWAAARAESSDPEEDES